MSRKDYIAVARVIADQVETGAVHGSGPHAVAVVARELADVFKSDNGAFDRQRFYFACGLNENGKIQ